jgi:FdhD protein
MRTPGNDVLLAIGYLYAESIINNYADVSEASQVDPNTVKVGLKNFNDIDWSMHNRQGLTSSSCGVCGKLSLDNYLPSNQEIKTEKFDLKKDILYSLPKKLMIDQSLFIETGGVHAAALFDIDGSLIAFKEDVGRHNALDKLLGYCLSQGMGCLDAKILLLSGRSSFELLQKASRLGVEIVCSIGAPSSNAIKIAEQNNITLIGFLKATGFNIYTHHEKVNIS